MADRPVLPIDLTKAIQLAEDAAGRVFAKHPDREALGALGDLLRDIARLAVQVAAPAICDQAAWPAFHAGRQSVAVDLRRRNALGQYTDAIRIAEGEATPTTIGDLAHLTKSPQ